MRPLSVTGGTYGGEGGLLSLGHCKTSQPRGKGLAGQAGARSTVRPQAAQHLAVGKVRGNGNQNAGGDVTQQEINTPLM